MSDQPANDLSLILAGERVPVVFLDGSQRIVVVRSLPARTLLTDYLAIIENEAVMLERVCERVAGDPALPAGWVDALGDASHAKLVETAERLNFARAVAQAERTAKRMAGLKEFESRMQSLLTTSPSPR